MASGNLSKRTLKKRLLASDSDNLPEKFVAAAVQLGASGDMFHAGISVGSEAGTHMFHFIRQIRKDDLKNCNMYYQHEFETIPSYLADAFYVHCSEAAESLAPQYGKFYNGTYFKDGKIINADECAPYRMSCVGFCLGVLQGWHTDECDFIAFEDWNADNSMSKDRVDIEMTELKRLHDYLDEEELRDGVRRIKPSDFLASAYLDEMPVRKADTDPIVVLLDEIGKELAAD